MTNNNSRSSFWLWYSKQSSVIQTISGIHQMLFFLFTWHRRVCQGWWRAAHRSLFALCLIQPVRWNLRMEVTPGPCCPLPPGEANVMSGSSFQGSTNSLVWTGFLWARRDSWDCGVEAVTVSTGSSIWEIKKFKSDTLIVYAATKHCFICLSSVFTVNYEN